MKNKHEKKLHIKYHRGHANETAVRNQYSSIRKLISLLATQVHGDVRASDHVKDHVWICGPEATVGGGSVLMSGAPVSSEDPVAT